MCRGASRNVRVLPCLPRHGARSRSIVAGLMESTDCRNPAVSLKMSGRSRKEVFEQARARYAGRRKEGRSRLLDEICALCGYERKYASKLLSGVRPLPGERGRGRGGSPARYGGSGASGAQSDLARCGAAVRQVFARGVAELVAFLPQASWSALGGSWCLFH